MPASAVAASASNTQAAKNPVSQSALAVSPAITEQVLTPGTTTVAKVRVTNITRVPLPIKGSIKNLTPLEDLLPATDKATYDASAWFTLEPADFIIQPNQTKEVVVTIATPPQATPGGHYATVYFQPLVPAEALTPSTAYLNARVGVLAFLVVKGNIIERASLEHLRLPGLTQNGPITINVPVKNSGNTHILPNGTVTIRNFRGKVIASLPLPAGLVLPKTIKQFAVQWDNKGKSGYYSAQAELTYGADYDKLQTGRVGFWVFPWVPAVVVITVMSLLGWFIAQTRTRWAAAWKALRGGDDKPISKV